MTSYEELWDLIYKAKRLYIEENNHQKAEELIKEALKINIKDVPAFSEIGVFYLCWNKLDESLNFFSKAHKMDKNYSIPILGLGVIYALKNKYNKSKKHFLLAIKSIDKQINNLKNTNLQLPQNAYCIAMCYEQYGQAFRNLAILIPKEKEKYHELSLNNFKNGAEIVKNYPPDIIGGLYSQIMRQIQDLEKDIKEGNIHI